MPTARFSRSRVLLLQDNNHKMLNSGDGYSKNQPMNLNESIELLGFVSAIPLNESANRPELRIFHNMSKGYTLHVKAQQVDTEYRKNLNKIAESLNLAIREEKGWLIIFRQL